MKYLKIVAVSILVVGLTGCAGVGVVSSSDPIRKITDAAHLHQTQGRPLIAERLIREAIVIFKQRKDNLGLGHASRTYANLLRSWSIKKWEVHYRRSGFLDKTVTYGNRFDRSNDYFREALVYYRKAEIEKRQTQKFGALSNTYYNMAYTHGELKDTKSACLYFDKARESNREAIKQIPDVKPASGAKNKTFDEVLVQEMGSMGCP